MAKQNFTIPKIVKYDDLSQPWYVHFRFNGKQKRIKGGINQYKSYKERLSEANALCKVLLEELKRGWDPFASVSVKSDHEIQIIKALDFALEKKKSNLAPKSYLGYKSCLGFLKISILDLRIDHLYISEITRYHVKLIVENAQEINNWSNKGYNKYLGIFKSIISELLEWNLIQQNPAHGIKSKKVEESQANIPPSNNEQRIIKEHLIDVDYNFFRFITHIYHTGIRPAELLKLKVGDVFMDKNIISLPPRITKTNKYRIVPINHHLKSILLEMELESHPIDFYLFGSYRESGRGNVGKYVDFIPGPTPISRDTATKRWKKLVKDQLGIQANMYSEKHKGADDKIIAGIDLDALRELYGHRSKLMTEKYARAIKDIYRKDIIDNSPEF